MGLQSPSNVQWIPTDPAYPRPHPRDVPHTLSSPDTKTPPFPLGSALGPRVPGAPRMHGSNLDPPRTPRPGPPPDDGFSSRFVIWNLIHQSEPGSSATDKGLPVTPAPAHLSLLNAFSSKNNTFVFNQTFLKSHIASLAFNEILLQLCSDTTDKCEFDHRTALLHKRRVLHTMHGCRN